MDQTKRMNYLRYSSPKTKFYLSDIVQKSFIGVNNVFCGDKLNESVNKNRSERACLKRLGSKDPLTSLVVSKTQEVMGGGFKSRN